RHERGGDAKLGVGRVRAQADGARRRQELLALRRRDHVGSAATTATISLPSASAPAWAARVTSSWLSGPVLTPAAGLATSDRPSTASPGWRAAITSWTGDIPTRQGPN